MCDSVYYYNCTVGIEVSGGEIEGLRRKSPTDKLERSVKWR